MLILQIEHKVPNYDGWKKAFDSDPIDRKKSGVKRYQIYRQPDDPGHVIVDLYFDNAEDAQATLGALQNLWNRVEGTVMVKAQTRMLQLVETIDL
jgi:N-acetyl-anhydromuramyl-L-alanine amidase AmpD